jgi:hypothetical protein
MAETLMNINEIGAASTFATQKSICRQPIASAAAAACLKCEDITKS